MMRNMVLTSINSCIQLLLPKLFKTNVAATNRDYTVFPKGLKSLAIAVGKAVNYKQAKTVEKDRY